MDTLLCKSYDTALPVVKYIDLAESGIAFSSLVGHTLTVGNQTYVLGENATTTATANVFGKTPINLAASLALAVNGDWDTHGVRHNKDYDNLSCYAVARSTRVYFISRIEAAAFVLTSADSLLTVTTISES
jgi:hypothetical protein